MGIQRPRFEIKKGDETMLKVYCERIEMHTPKTTDAVQSIAGLTSFGQVRFFGPGLEGTCDELAIASVTGEVSLKGNIRMKCKRGTTYSDVAADSMTFQMVGTGLISQSEPKSGTITPVEYQQAR